MAILRNFPCSSSFCGGMPCYCQSCCSYRMNQKANQKELSGNYWLRNLQYNESCFPKPDYNDAYDDWFEELCRTASVVNLNYPRMVNLEGYVRNDKEGWRTYFGDGFSPDHALEMILGVKV